MYVRHVAGFGFGPLLQGQGRNESEIYKGHILILPREM
jgi:hypothetical protein